jgi:hypothetical protein
MLRSVISGFHTRLGGESPQSRFKGQQVGADLGSRGIRTGGALAESVMHQALNLRQFGQKRGVLTGVIATAHPEDQQILALEFEIRTDGERLTCGRYLSDPTLFSLDLHGCQSGPHREKSAADTL